MIMGQILELKNAIKQAEKKFASDSVAQSFEQSAEEFKKMVSDGFAKSRGYNILSVENSFLTTQC